MGKSRGFMAWMGLEKWKGGMVEECDDLIIRQWKSGKMEEWKDGLVEEWNTGNIELR